MLGLAINQRLVQQKQREYNCALSAANVATSPPPRGPHQQHAVEFICKCGPQIIIVNVALVINSSARIKCCINCVHRGLCDCLFARSSQSSLLRQLLIADCVQIGAECRRCGAEMCILQYRESQRPANVIMSSRTISNQSAECGRRLMIWATNKRRRVWEDCSIIQIRLIDFLRTAVAWYLPPQDTGEWGGGERERER